MLLAPTGLAARARVQGAVGRRSLANHGPRPLAPALRGAPFSRIVGTHVSRRRSPLRVGASAAAGGAAHPPAPAADRQDSASSKAETLTGLFPVFVLGAAAAGLFQPAAFNWFSPAAITPALAVTMLGMGLTLTLEDFKRVLTTPGRIFAGFALQYTVMPALAYAVSRLAGLPLAFTIGLCIVGSCPGGTASNVVTYLARGDVPLSVAMTTASTLGAALATPFLTQALLGTLVPVDAAALFVSTLQVVLLPVVVGAAINTAFPKQVAALRSLCTLSAVSLISLICGSVIAQNAAAVVQAGPRLLAAVCALHAGGFLLGYALSKALGLPERTARTNSIEVGMQNSALGAMLATAHFPAHPLAAVPCAISACMHSVMGSLLAAVWRAQPTGEEELAAAQAVQAAAQQQRQLQDAAAQPPASTPASTPATPATPVAPASSATPAAPATPAATTATAGLPAAGAGAAAAAEPRLSLGTGKGGSASARFAGGSGGLSFAEGRAPKAAPAPRPSLPPLKQQHQQQQQQKQKQQRSPASAPGSLQYSPRSGSGAASFGRGGGGGKRATAPQQAEAGKGGSAAAAAAAAVAADAVPVSVAAELAPAVLAPPAAARSRRAAGGTGGLSFKGGGGSGLATFTTLRDEAAQQQGPQPTAAAAKPAPRLAGASAGITFRGVGGSGSLTFGRQPPAASASPAPAAEAGFPPGAAPTPPPAADWMRREQALALRFRGRVIDRSSPPAAKAGTAATAAAAAAPPAAAAAAAAAPLKEEQEVEREAEHASAAAGFAGAGLQPAWAWDRDLLSIGKGCAGAHAEGGMAGASAPVHPPSALNAVLAPFLKLFGPRGTQSAAAVEGEIMAVQQLAQQQQQQQLVQPGGAAAPEEESGGTDLNFGAAGLQPAWAWDRQLLSMGQRYASGQSMVGAADEQPAGSGTSAAAAAAAAAEPGIAAESGAEQPGSGSGSAGSSFGGAGLQPAWAWDRELLSIGERYAGGAVPPPPAPSAAAPAVSTGSGELSVLPPLALNAELDLGAVIEGSQEWVAEWHRRLTSLQRADAAAEEGTGSADAAVAATGGSAEGAATSAADQQQQGSTSATAAPAFGGEGLQPAWAWDGQLLSMGQRYASGHSMVDAAEQSSSGSSAGAGPSAAIMQPAWAWDGQLLSIGQAYASGATTPAPPSGESGQLSPPPPASLGNVFGLKGLLEGHQQWAADWRRQLQAQLWASQPSDATPSLPAQQVPEQEGAGPAVQLLQSAATLQPAWAWDRQLLVMGQRYASGQSMADGRSASSADDSSGSGAAASVTPSADGGAAGPALELLQGAATVQPAWAWDRELLCIGQQYAGTAGTAAAPPSVAAAAAAADGAGSGADFAVPPPLALKLAFDGEVFGESAQQFASEWGHALTGAPRLGGSTPDAADEAQQAQQQDPPASTADAPPAATAAPAFGGEGLQPAWAWDGQLLSMGQRYASGHSIVDAVEQSAAGSGAPAAAQQPGPAAGPSAAVVQPAWALDGQLLSIGQAYASGATTPAPHSPAVGQAEGDLSPLPPLALKTAWDGEALREGPGRWAAEWHQALVSAPRLDGSAPPSPAAEAQQSPPAVDSSAAAAATPAFGGEGLQPAWAWDGQLLSMGQRYASGHSMVDAAEEPSGSNAAGPSAAVVQPAWAWDGQLLSIGQAYASGADDVGEPSQAESGELPLPPPRSLHIEGDGGAILRGAAQWAADWHRTLITQPPLSAAAAAAAEAGHVSAATSAPPQVETAPPLSGVDLIYSAAGLQPAWAYDTALLSIAHSYAGAYAPATAAAPAAAAADEKLPPGAALEAALSRLPVPSVLSLTVEPDMAAVLAGSAQWAAEWNRQLLTGQAYLRTHAADAEERAAAAEAAAAAAPAGMAGSMRARRTARRASPPGASGGLSFSAGGGSGSVVFTLRAPVVAADEVAPAPAGAEVAAPPAQPGQAPQAEELHVEPPAQVVALDDSLPNAFQVAALFGFTALLGLAWGTVQLTEPLRQWAVDWHRKLRVQGMRRAAASTASSSAAANGSTSTAGTTAGASTATTSNGAVAPARNGSLPAPAPVQARSQRLPRLAGASGGLSFSSGGGSGSVTFTAGRTRRPGPTSSEGSSSGGNGISHTNGNGASKLNGNAGASLNGNGASEVIQHANGPKKPEPMLVAECAPAHAGLAAALAPPAAEVPPSPILLSRSAGRNPGLFSLERGRSAGLSFHRSGRGGSGRAAFSGRPQPTAAPLPAGAAAGAAVAPAGVSSAQQGVVPRRQAEAEAVVEAVAEMEDLVLTEVLLHQLFPSFRAPAPRPAPTQQVPNYESSMPSSLAVALFAGFTGLLGLAWAGAVATEAPRRWARSWHHRLLADGQRYMYSNAAAAQEAAAAAAAARAAAALSTAAAASPQPADVAAAVGAEAAPISPGHLDAKRPERVPDYNSTLPSGVAIAAFAGFTAFLGLAWAAASVTEAPRNFVTSWSRRLRAAPRLHCF